MYKKVYKSILIGFLLAVITSCGNSDVRIIGNTERDTGQLTEAQIPPGLLKNFEGRKNWFYGILGLADLKSVHEGTQIQVSEDYRNDSAFIFSLKDSIGTMTANLTNCRINRFDSLVSPLREIKSVTYQQISLGAPKSGWQNFRRKLYQFDFDRFLVKERNAESFDSEWMVLTIESTYQGKYVVGNYRDFYEDNTKELKELKTFVRFIREEFDIR